MAILFVRYDSTKEIAYSDSAGGFVLAHIKPGRYTLAVRQVGFIQQASSQILTAGAIDTVRVRLRIDPNRFEARPSIK